jgi:hypothetical protein
LLELGGGAGAAEWPVVDELLVVGVCEELAALAIAAPPPASPAVTASAPTIVLIRCLNIVHLLSLA